ncbi:pilus assembly protein [Novosphingobium sp. G106]|nr:pilus assembly protein [Novosphingobium sp. G106]
MPITQLLRRLSGDQRGVSVLQFAIIAPAFIAVMIAVIEIAFVYLAQGGLETAADAASRELMTGQAQQGGMTSAQFKTAVCASLPPYLKCSSLMIDVSTASSYSGANLGTPTLTYDSSGNVNNSFSYNPGTQGAIVVVRLMYLWPTITGPLGFNISNQTGNNRLLIATSVLKSEYY